MAIFIARYRTPMLTNDKPQVQSSRHQYQSSVSENASAGTRRACSQAGRRRTRDRLDCRRRSDGVPIPSQSCLDRTPLHQCRPFPPVHSIPVLTLMLACMHPNISQPAQFLQQSNTSFHCVLLCDVYIVYMQKDVKFSVLFEV